MISAVNLLLVGILLLNLFMLGTSRIRGLIHAAALQGVVLGVMPLLLGGHNEWELGLIAIGTVVLKGVFIPQMLRRALREAQIKREVEPLIGFVPTMLLGAAGTLLSVAFGSELPLEPQHRDLLIVPASLSTVATQNSCSAPRSSFSASVSIIPRSSYSKNAPIDVGKTMYGAPPWPKTSSSISRPSCWECQRW